MTRLLDDEAAQRAVAAVPELSSSLHTRIEVGRAISEGPLQMCFHGESTHMRTFLPVTQMVNDLLKHTRPAAKKQTANTNKHRHVTNTGDESSHVFVTCRARQ